jgi:hypothetical protein
LITFRYKRPDGTSRFVVTRIQSPDDAVETIKVQIEGAVILDSEGNDLEKENTVLLQPNRCIIGEGVFDLR